MWKVYKWNGQYIQGDLISEHKTESAAIKAAAKKIKFLKTEKEKKGKQIFIWLDGVGGDPLGVIVKKTK
jgi:hypothetical protein